jgi:hypothetical protein
MLQPDVVRRKVSIIVGKNTANAKTFRNNETSIILLWCSILERGET